MQVPLAITPRHIPQADALGARIRSKVAKPGEFHPNVTGGTVAVERGARRRGSRLAQWG